MAISLALACPFLQHSLPISKMSYLVEQRVPGDIILYFSFTHFTIRFFLKL
jgi:hypothetical protein